MLASCVYRSYMPHHQLWQALSQLKDVWTVTSGMNFAASLLHLHCQPSCDDSSDSPALYSGMRLYSVKNFFRMMRNCCGMLRAYLELNFRGSESGAGCCRLSISSCLCLQATSESSIKASHVM